MKNPFRLCMLKWYLLAGVVGVGTGYALSQPLAAILGGAFGFGIGYLGSALESERGQR